MSKSPLLHCVAQIRAKQLAIKDTQNSMLQNILDNKNPDISDVELTNHFIEQLELDCNTSLAISNHLKTENVNNVGYPIKFNKTHLQLKMASEWAKENKDTLLESIEHGKFYHNLTNEVSNSTLPILRSSNTESFWGNENSSVSSVMLYSLAKVTNTEINNLSGAAMSFPMYSSSYHLPEILVPETYSFADVNKMLLFGDYQYGGHRYLNSQFVFGPEDCSSAVGKATYLSDNLLKMITTTGIRQTPSNFNYSPVVVLHGSVSEENLELIQPGDIYLAGTHCAIVSAKPNNQGIINTVQFNRDIDVATDKILGGGEMAYNLSEKVKATDIYIFRSNTLEPLREDCSISEMIEMVDHRYTELFPQGPIDITGDCQIFLE